MSDRDGRSSVDSDRLLAWAKLKIHAEESRTFNSTFICSAVETDATPFQSLKIIIQIKNLHLRAAIKINILLHINVFITTRRSWSWLRKIKNIMHRESHTRSPRREKPSRHDLRRPATVLLVGIFLYLLAANLSLARRSRAAVIWWLIRQQQPKKRENDAYKPTRQTNHNKK